MAVCLATGKYGCRKVRVYPAECGEQLGRDLSKNGSSKSLVLKIFFWGGHALGFVPSNHPHSLGCACTLYGPTSPGRNGCMCDGVCKTGFFLRSSKKSLGMPLYSV